MTYCTDPYTCDTRLKLIFNFNFATAPLSQPVEIEVKKRSDTAIHIFWRGFSTTQLEEPLEGYKVNIRLTKFSFRRVHETIVFVETVVYFNSSSLPGSDVERRRGYKERHRL